MAITALSLPEMVILRKVMKPRLLVACVGIVAGGVVAGGIVVIDYLWLSRHPTHAREAHRYEGHQGPRARLQQLPQA